jgi:hypothetical protein
MAWSIRALMSGAVTGFAAWATKVTVSLATAGNRLVRTSCAACESDPGAL